MFLITFLMALIGLRFYLVKRKKKKEAEWIKEQHEADKRRMDLIIRSSQEAIKSRTEELILQGLTPENASKQAFIEENKHTTRQMLRLLSRPYV